MFSAEPLSFQFENVLFTRFQFSSFQYTYVYIYIYSFLCSMAPFLDGGAFMVYILFSISKYIMQLDCQ